MATEVRASCTSPHPEGSAHPLSVDTWRSRPHIFQVDSSTGQQQCDSEHVTSRKLKWRHWSESSTQISMLPVA